MPLQIQDGEIIGVAATAGCTAGAIWNGTARAGVFLDTYAAASTNTNVPVALRGRFTVTKKAHATAWSAGRKIYSLTTGGVNKAVGAATGSAVPLGIALGTVATSATSGDVLLCSF